MIFANLTGCMGKSWFNVNVWKFNKLSYKEIEGNWKNIYKMITTKDNIYFSRGMNEIVSESKDYSDLLIEEKLVLIYDRDFLFYLSKKDKNAGFKYKNIIEKALNKSKKSGLIRKLVRKYWRSNYKILNYDKRVKLSLKTPK
ncbi:MAG: hypothetical protein GY714_04670 [Desulfobacterales bacterium]|nr:hypothetical protein [Desulfobacterales bacterium]